MRGFRTGQVVKTYQIDILAFSVLRHFQQIDYAQETGLAGECGSNIRKTDRLDRVDFDFAFFHAVAYANFDVRLCPYPDAAGDFSAANFFAQPLGEQHIASLQGVCRRCGAIENQAGRQGFSEDTAECAFVAFGFGVELRGQLRVCDFRLYSVECRGRDVAHRVAGSSGERDRASSDFDAGISASIQRVAMVGEST